MAMPSAMGAAHSTPSMPMESGNVTASGIKNKTSRKTEATTARTGLPAAWKNSDVIFYRASKRDKHQEYAERLDGEVFVQYRIGVFGRAEYADNGERRKLEQQRCDQPYRDGAQQNIEK